MFEAIVLLIFWRHKVKKRSHVSQKCRVYVFNQLSNSNVVNSGVCSCFLQYLSAVYNCKCIYVVSFNDLYIFCSMEVCAERCPVPIVVTMSYGLSIDDVDCASTFWVSKGIALESDEVFFDWIVQWKVAVAKVTHK